MTVTVEKMVTFDEEEWASHIINNLYDMMEYGCQCDDWECLTEEQQTTIAKEILTKAICLIEEDE